MQMGTSLTTPTTVLVAPVEPNVSKGTGPVDAAGVANAKVDVMVVVVIVRTPAITGTDSSHPGIDGGLPHRGGFLGDSKRPSTQSCRRLCAVGSGPKTGSCTLNSGGMVRRATVHPGYP